MSIKKVIVSVVLLVGVAFVTEAMIVSSMVGKNMGMANEMIDAHPMLKVVESSYKGGMMGGEAMTRVSLGGIDENIEITLLHKVSTMPVFVADKGGLGAGLAHITTTVKLDEKQQAMVDKLFGGAVPTLETTVTFTNEYNMFFSIPSIKLDENNEFSDPEGNKHITKTLIDFSGLRTNINMTSDASRVSGDLAVPNFSMQKQDATNNTTFFMKVDQISSKFNFTRKIKNLYIGDGDMKADAVHIGNMMMQVKLLDNEMNYRVIDKKDVIDYEMDASIKEIKADGGMSIPFTSFTNKMAFRNLDAIALVEYTEAIEKQTQQSIEANPEVFMMELMTVADKLLKLNVSIIDSIQLGTTHGNAYVNINVSFQALEPNMSIQTMNPVKDLLPRLTARVDAKLPKALLDTTPFAPQIPQYIQMGYVKDQGGYYISKALFDKSILTINGTPIDLAQFGLPIAQGGNNTAVKP